MKTLFLLIALVTLGCSGKQQPNPDAVIVCMGKYSKAYHMRNDCTGLDNCKGELKTFTLKEAQELGRHGCSRCVAN